MGLASSVSFLGWRQDAGGLIPLLDAVLLPSHFEGLPQTALQAASAGVPVVAYAVDGLVELLPQQFLVPHGDEPGFARATRELIQGARSWPQEDMAKRAVEWGDPGRAADQLLRLFGGRTYRRMTCRWLVRPWPFPGPWSRYIPRKTPEPCRGPGQRADGPKRGAAASCGSRDHDPRRAHRVPMGRVRCGRFAEASSPRRPRRRCPERYW